MVKPGMILTSLGALLMLLGAAVYKGAHPEVGGVLMSMSIFAFGYGAFLNMRKEKGTSE
jgi:uncharacterized membrane protein